MDKRIQQAGVFTEPVSENQKQGYKYGELDDDGKTAGKRIGAVFFVKLHGVASLFLLVFVFFANFFELGLKFAHFSLDLY